MGGLMSKQMGKVMDENLKNMRSMQEMTLERQLQMQQQMRARMVAQQLGMAREAFLWWGSFYGLALIGMAAGYVKTRNQAVLAPLLPLTFVVGYQADMALGNKMERIVAYANDILDKEPSLVTMPGKPLSIELLDQGRLAAKSSKKK